jgi:hypothetical protein
MLSNIEKENLVIDLYYNQRKNVRQISQEARDVSAIIKKKEAVNDDGNGSGNGIEAVDNHEIDSIYYKLMHSEQHHKVVALVLLVYPAWNKDEDDKSYLHSGSYNIQDHSKESTLSDFTEYYVFSHYIK